MHTTLTEKDCPTQGKWLLKRFLAIFLALLPVLAVFGGFWYLFSWVAKNGTSVRDKADMVAATQVMSYIFLGLIAIMVISFIILVLRRLTFHYAIDEKFLVSDQGIIAKRKSYIPYFRVQHIIVKRDLLDKFFGIASVAIENAAQGGDGTGGNMRRNVAFLAHSPLLYLIQKQLMDQVDIIGFNGNRMGIPGLNLSDCEKVKTLLLQQIKHGSLEDTKSGL